MNLRDAGLEGRSCESGGPGGGGTGQEASSEERAKEVQRFGGGPSIWGRSDGRGGTRPRCLSDRHARPRTSFGWYRGLTLRGLLSSPRETLVSGLRSQLSERLSSQVPNRLCGSNLSIPVFAEVEMSRPDQRAEKTLDRIRRSGTFADKAPPKAAHASNGADGGGAPLRSPPIGGALRSDERDRSASREVSQERGAGGNRRQTFASRLRANVHQPLDIDGSDSDDSSSLPVVGGRGWSRPGRANRPPSSAAADATNAVRDLNDAGLAALAKRDLKSARQSLENAAGMVQHGAGGPALNAAVLASLGCTLLRAGHLDRAVVKLNEAVLALSGIAASDFDADAALAARSDTKVYEP